MLADLACVSSVIHRQVASFSGVNKRTLTASVFGGNVYCSSMARKPTSYDFIDLFAGIGGFHLAFNNTNRARCVFASEWDPAARLSYQKFYGKSDPHLFKDLGTKKSKFNRDITELKTDSDILDAIPPFNILCGGFPCQPFSQAGKKLGFSDTRGTLFFNVERILSVRSPDVFFLENVRGLLSHGGESSSPGVGRTMEVILDRLFKPVPEGLGYHKPNGFDGRKVGYFVVKASDYGVPQHRPRVFIIGFKDPAAAEAFQPPKPVDIGVSNPTALAKILGGSRKSKVFFDEKGNKERRVGFTLRCGGKGSDIYDRRNWEHYWVQEKPESKIIPMKIDERIGLRLLGFPPSFRFPEEVGKTQRMKQLGNSVAVTAVEAWGLAIIDALDRSTYVRP